MPWLGRLQEEIAAAFRTLGAAPATGKMSRETLLSLLHTLGEPMTKTELVTSIRALTGADSISAVLPNQVDSTQFAQDLLGFEKEEEAAA